jgi:hypothetical protein
MSDRKLLELAAKAAGYEYLWNIDSLLIKGLSGRWNPIADDGDALRLAVKCGIEIWPDREAKEVVVGFCIGKGQNMVGLNFSANFEDDEMAATRLAIVRAAAQIGDAIRTGGPVWPTSSAP